MSLKNGRISYDESEIRVLNRMREVLAELPPKAKLRLRLMQMIRVELSNARNRERALSVKSLHANGFRNSLRAK